MRLRQAVFIAADLEPAVASLRDTLGLAEPYADPHVAIFGLHNAVLAVGDEFLEVVSPTQDGTPAARHLDRRGEGGYMAIVQVDDLDAARKRAADLGVRTAWEIDLPDVRATHFHPADVGGVILSLDAAVPAESWFWAGPGWQGGAGAPGPGRLRGITVESPDPHAAAAIWASLLGVEPDLTLRLGENQEICFTSGTAGLVEVAVESPQHVPAHSDALRVGNARVRLVSA